MLWRETVATEGGGGGRGGQEGGGIAGVDAVQVSVWRSHGAQETRVCYCTFIVISVICVMVTVTVSQRTKMNKIDKNSSFFIYYGRHIF